MPHTPLSLQDLAALGRERSGGLALTDAQARVLGALHAHAFSGPRSCPSQDLIACEVGLSREWVNRVCRDLWALGLIAWTKTRQKGAQWAHNVYRLRHWQPAGTARVLGLLKRIRGRRLRPLHMETATTAPRTSSSARSTTQYPAPLWEEVHLDPGGCVRVVLVASSERDEGDSTT